MIKLYSAFLTFFSLTAAMAAQSTPQTSTSPTIELLTNGNFEAYKAGWTSSSAPIFTIDTAAPLNGNASGVFTATANSQSVSTAQNVIKEGLKGGNCAATMIYKTSESTNLYSWEVIDGSSNVLAQATLNPTSIAIPAALTFTCPASGTVAVKYLSSGSALALKIDDVTLGSNQLIQVSQAQSLGSARWPGGTGCTWTSTSNNSFSAFGVQSSCVLPSGSNLSGQAQAPSTKIPAIKFSSLAPGDYVVHATGIFTQSTGGQTCSFAISDGTNVVQSGGIGASGGIGNSSNTIKSKFSYSTTQGPTTFDIESTGINSSVTCLVQNDNSSSAPEDLNIWVEYFPSQSQTAVNVATSAQSWSGYQANSGGWTTSSTSFADPAAGTGVTLTETANQNFGTVINEGSGLPGVTWSPTKTGNFLVKSIVTVYDNTGETPSWQLVDGSSVVIDPGHSATVGVNEDAVIPLAGIYNVTSIGSPVTFKLKGKGQGGTTGISAGASGAAIQWVIIDISQNVPAPVLVNSVVQPGGGVKNMISVNICGDVGCTTACTGTCAIGTGTGEGVTSVVRASTGFYTVTFNAGVFSSGVVCQSTDYNASDVAQIFPVPTTSSVVVHSFAPTTGTPNDDAVGLICYGNK